MILTDWTPSTRRSIAFPTVKLSSDFVACHSPSHGGSSSIGSMEKSLLSLYLNIQPHLESIAGARPLSQQRYLRPAVASRDPPSHHCPSHIPATHDVSKQLKRQHMLVASYHLGPTANNVMVYISRGTLTLTTFQYPAMRWARNGRIVSATRHNYQPADRPDHQPSSLGCDGCHPGLSWVAEYLHIAAIYACTAIVHAINRIAPK